MSSPASAPSHSSRYLLMAVIGLLVGVLAATMLMRALQARHDPVPDSVMQLMAWKLQKLSPRPAGDNCSSQSSQAQLRGLELLAADIDAAFPELADDTRFSAHRQQLQQLAGNAATTPPAICSALAELHDQLRNSCEACHNEYR